MPDYPKLIKDRERELLGLYGRMDDDRKLLYLANYVMKDAKGKDVRDVVNVTLNKPSVFASNVISALNSTRQQVVVESDSSKVETADIEEFIQAAFDTANYARVNAGEAHLNFFADTQCCIRGRAARRVLFRIEDGVLKSDIQSWDTRFVTYEQSDEGLAWAAYKSYRGKAQIEAEYGHVIPSQYGWVSDVWDSDHNEVWIGNDKVLEQEHFYGFCPVVLQIVGLGYGNILMDDDRLKYEGESIFYMIRSLVPELNRWITILQTLNLKTIKPPIKQKKKGGGEPEEYEDLTGMGAVTAIEPEEDIARIDYGDAIRATQLVYQAIEKGLQEGSYTDIDIGNVKQPFSAVALITIGESKDQVYLPRLAARETLNQATADMFIRQVVQVAQQEGMATVELGLPGHKRAFKVSDLEQEYQISFKSFLKSPKTDVARMAIAQQAQEFYDPMMILEDVLQVENPKEVMRKRYYYMAEKIDPNILRHRVIMNLLEMADEGDEDAEIEAEIMAASMGVSIEQIKQGQIAPAAAPANGQNRQEGLLPLLGKGGTVGEIPRAAIRSASPDEAGTD